MEAIVVDYFDQLADPFFNPQKRVFIGYLLGGMVIALVAQCFHARASFRRWLKTVFSPRIWWSKSSRCDYKIFLINQAIMMGWMPRFVSKLTIATFFFETLHIWFDGRVSLWSAAPSWLIATIFTFSLFLLDDGAKYIVHRALHRVPLLWCFHKVHHTAEVLTPLTVYRTHPIEGAIFALRAILVQAIAAACFLFFFGDRAELITVLGANTILFVFNATGSNLRHSHVWISYGSILEHGFISPAQHQLHHSAALQHGNKNFGAVLALWDWAGHTLLIAGKKQPITFGVWHEKQPKHNLSEIYLMPFLHASYILARWTKCLNLLLFGLYPKNAFSKSISGAGIVALVFLTLPGRPSAAAELNIYSHRQPFLIKPFIDAYRAKTGTNFNIVYASKGLAQRLQAEGARSPADVILTVDIARLFVYADKGLLAPVKSEILSKNIPTHLRDPGNKWFAFSKRARVIAIAKRAKDTSKISRYEDLADPKWQDRICARPGSHVYNRALVASLIHATGIDGAQKWATGVINNLARRPQGNDRAQVKAIYEGVCDITIINNYYFGKLKHSKKMIQRQWAASIDLIFPNQDDRGTHVNISGGGVAKHSKNKKGAMNFLEFLTSKAAQDLYGAINFEYPVNPAVKLSKELRSWGKFKEDKMPIARIAELAPEAQKVIDRVGW